MSRRLQAMGQEKYANGFQVNTHHNELKSPAKWRKPSMVFVCSMGDLFHDDVPYEFISEVFAAIHATPQHTYQLLTKRAERLASLAPDLDWPKNLWMGVTVENRDYIHRVNELSKVPAAVRFLSCEPLLGPLNQLPLDSVDWVIVGGESGPGSRLMSSDWVRDLKDQCISQNVPFFFKQWGGVNKKKAGRELDGKVWQQFPKETR
jgi:protein gp37